MYDYLDSDGVQAVLEAVKDKIPTVSNPNLLINPDFKINQRNVSGTFSETGKYFVDRWKLVSGTVTINTDGTLTLNGSICQPLENAVGDNVTASVSAGTAIYDDTAKTFTISANGETISWAKLEYGSVNTPFVTPDISDEMPKCLRYFEKRDYTTTSGLSAVMWANKLSECHTNIPFYEKRITSPSVTVSSFGWRFVASLGVTNISGCTVNWSTKNSTSITFTLSSAFASPAFGWVDRFSVTIDAEL